MGLGLRATPLYLMGSDSEESVLCSFFHRRDGIDYLITLLTDT